MAAVAAAAALLSIVRPIIYSQLKVHRVSAAKTAARTAEGGREGRMPFRVHSMVSPTKWVGFSPAAIW